MQATGSDSSYDTAHVAAALVFVALGALFLLNRVTTSVNISAKVG